MKTKRKEYFQNLEPKVDLEKLMKKVKKRGCLFYRSAKRKRQNEKNED